MRKIQPGWWWVGVFGVLAVTTALVTGRWTPLPLGAAVEPSAFEDDEENPQPRKGYETELSTPLVGDYTNFAGLEPTPLEGVGLVVGLSGTGGDPAPSLYRTALLEDMKKRGVRNPNTLLQSPDTALVVVRTYLPPLMKKGEVLDVEVIAPDGSEVTSLNGGWLLETYLTEQAFVPGRGVLKGHPYARASGPLLLAGTGSSNGSAAAERLQKKGRVLGGGFVLKERELAIHLRNEYRSIRNSTRISEAIGKRFHHFDQHGIKKPMAEAKTDQKLTLDVHPRYKDNYPRYLQVIRHIAFRETPVGQRVRMQRLHDELLTGETADRAALQLEAIGKDSIPILKVGLKSGLIEVRFHSALALAYLDDAEGLPALAEAAKDERAFRVFALAGMSTVDDAQAHLLLRDLMSEPSAETRYGAFRALWTLDKNDPFIRGVPMGLPEVEEVTEENKAAFKAGWMLHVLQTKGEPLTHCTLRTRPEVVLFGAGQKFVPPLVLSAGRKILITAQPGNEKVTIVKFSPNKADERREVSLRVADVLQAADELGATYPDIVQLLAQASEQRNLEAKLENDALPESGRIYARPAQNEKPGSKSKVGREHLSPNIFPRSEEDAQFKNNEGMQAQTVGATPKGMANVPEKGMSNDAPAEQKPATKPEKPRSFWNPWGWARK